MEEEKRMDDETKYTYFFMSSCWENQGEESNVSFYYFCLLFYGTFVTKLHYLVNLRLLSFSINLVGVHQLESTLVYLDAPYNVL